MFKKLLSLAALALCAGSMNAADEITSGTNYYIQNVESGLFFSGANSWGTLASATVQGELFTVTLDGAVYTIEDQALSVANKYLNYPNDQTSGNLFTDVAKTNNKDMVGTWTIEAVSGEAGVFTIKNDQGYIAEGNNADVIGKVLTQVSEVTSAAKWYFLTAEEAKAKLDDATQSAPVDASFLISCANFTRNHTNTAWNNTGSGNMAGGNNNNFCAESWQAAFDVNQTVSVPNGVYALTAQAALTDYTNAYDGADYPVVYANTESVPFNSMEESDRKTNMVTLSTSFTKGKYVVSPIYVKVTDGSLKIGVKGTRTNTWCIWDNFQLKYYGASANITELKLGAYLDAYRTALQTAEAIDQDAKMGASELAALKKALEDYPESTVVVSTATSESLNTAKTALETAADNAKTSIKKYANDKTRRDQYAARAAAAGVTVSTAAFDAAYEANTLANEIADIKTVLDTEVDKVVSAYVDKSDVITNPGFDDPRSTEGWTTDPDGSDKWSGLHVAGNTNFSKYSGVDYVEMWRSGPGTLPNAKISQTITLPAGVYILTAEAQLLQQGDANVIPGGMYIYAGENKTEVTNQAETYVVAFNVAADGTEVEIGAKLDGSTGNWACVDNFQIKTLAKVTGKMNAGVKTAQDNAFSAYAADATAEKKAAMLTAMANANASVAEYTAIDAAITATANKANALDDDGKAAYDASSIQTKYDNGTYTTAAEAKTELSTALVTAVKAQTSIGADMTGAVENAECTNGMAPNPAGWALEREIPNNWKIYDGEHNIQDLGTTMHINTWSNEGDSDGSNMTTSFVELWNFNPDKDVNVMHDQIEGLAKGNYTVTIFARVRDLKDGATSPAGISFKANGTASTTEWTAGTACSYATLTVNAEVTDEGTLDFGFSYVKDEVNFTWLSFKNVTLTYNGNIIARTTATEKYGTICVPGVVKATGATLYSAKVDGASVILTEVTTPEAGKPYIYQATADAQTFAYGNGGKVATPVPAGLLRGVFSDTPVPVGSYVMQTKDGVQKFFKVAEGKQPTLSANKAYLVEDTGSSEVKAYSIGADNGEETAIKAIDALTSGDAKIYDLNGRELKSLQKGVNIVNGVKVMVK